MFIGQDVSTLQQSIILSVLLISEKSLSYQKNIPLRVLIQK